MIVGDDAVITDWEWVGPDGLTDSRRSQLVDAWRQGYGDRLTDHEEYLVKRYLGIACACSCIRCGPVSAHDCGTSACNPGL